MKSLDRIWSRAISCWTSALGHATPTMTNSPAIDLKAPDRVIRSDVASRWGRHGHHDPDASVRKVQAHWRNGLAPIDGVRVGGCLCESAKENINILAGAGAIRRTARIRKDVDRRAFRCAGRALRFGRAELCQFGLARDGVEAKKRTHPCHVARSHRVEHGIDIGHTCSFVGCVAGDGRFRGKREHLAEVGNVATGPKDDCCLIGLNNARPRLKDVYAWEDRGRIQEEKKQFAATRRAASRDGCCANDRAKDGDAARACPWRLSGIAATNRYEPEIAVAIQV